MKKIMLYVVCGVLAVTAFAVQNEAPSVNSLPPSVVKTVPECGDVNVDANATTEIGVTFSKEMLDRSWSWTQISKDTFPQIIGEPKYLGDKKTCVVNVKLQPNKTYVIWFNSPKNPEFRNFKDTGERSAVSYQLVFQTK